MAALYSPHSLNYAKAAWKVAHYHVWLAGRSPARVSRQPIRERAPHG